MSACKKMFFYSLVLGTIIKRITIKRCYPFLFYLLL